MTSLSASGCVGDSAINDERALQNAAVFACVRVITQNVSSLPLDVFRIEDDKCIKLHKHEHWLARLLRHKPNAHMTALEFREAMNLQLCFYGNAYAVIARNAVQEVIALTPLHALKMDVLLENNQVIYRYQHDRGYIDYQPKEIFHLKNMSVNGLVGISPIACASRILGTAIAAEDHQRTFFANGCKTPKILTTKVDQTQQQMKDAQKIFGDLAAGPMNQRLRVIPGAFDLHELGLSPLDADLMQARSYQLADISRIFGVPLHLINEVEKNTSWGSGIEQTNIQFLQYTLKPYLERWEETIAQLLIKDEDQAIYAEHNLKGLLRADSKTQAEVYASHVNNGIMTRNEIRRLENLPPLPGGDELTIPLNLLPKEKKKKEREKDKDKDKEKTNEKMN